MLNPAIEDILDKLEPMEGGCAHLSWLHVDEGEGGEVTLRSALTAVLFPGLMAQPPTSHASQGRVDSPPVVYSSGTGHVADSSPFHEVLTPADHFKVPRPPTQAISIARPPEESTPMSVSPMLSFLDKPGPSVFQQPMDGILPHTAAAAKDIKQEPIVEADTTFAKYPLPSAPCSSYPLPSPPCSTLESLLNQPVFSQSTQQAVGVTVGPAPQQSEGFPVHSSPLEAATDPSQDNRPFGNKLFDEKAQLHKSISSLQKLEQVQRQQMRELDKQRQLATLEYQDLLRQYISQTGEASTAQQQMLHSVVSDPTMMGILQNVLMQAQAQTMQPPLSTASTPPPPTTPNMFDAAPVQPSGASFRHPSTGEGGGVPTDTQSSSMYDTSTVTGSDSTLMSLLTNTTRRGV